MILAYQKSIDAVRSVELRLPVDGDGHPVGTELATIDGTTYVHVPDGVTLPEQPTSIAPVSTALTPAVIKAIKARSPHVRLINQRVVERIREKYDLNDELQMLRESVLAGADYDEYLQHVKACRAWGKAQRVALGLA
jgi:hypothetical protein